MLGMQSDGMPVMFPMYGAAFPLPCSSWILSSSVILAMSSETRVAIGAAEPTQGQAPLSAADRSIVVRVTLSGEFGSAASVTAAATTPTDTPTDTPKMPRDHNLRPSERRRGDRCFMCAKPPGSVVSRSLRGGDRRAALE